MKISVTPNCTSDVIKHTTIDVVLEGIKTGGKQKKLVENVRRLVAEGGSESEIKEAKLKLSAIMFNGTFNKRGAGGLIEGSGFMILDFDHVEVGFLEKLKASIYTYACWLSPTGRGYKALIKIPIVKNDHDYKRYFYAVQKDNPEIDPSGKDVSRLCFFSYDADLYINEKSEVWTTQIADDVRRNSNGKNVKVVNSNMNKIGLAVSMIRNAAVGDRHATMLKAGRLIGGYIAGGEIDEFESLTIFQNIIQENAPDDYKDHTKAFLDGIVFGKQTPLSETEIEQIPFEDKLGKVHVEGEEVQSERDYLYENGYKKGYYVGWQDLDKLYSVHLGSTTYIYSAPHTGKTQFWNQCLVNLSMFYRMKHLIFSPETGSATDIYIELAQIYARKDYVGNFKMSPEERKIADAFVNEHFIVLDGDAYDKSLSAEDICMYAKILEGKMNIKFQTITIDPFNELKMDYGKHRDLAIEDTLQYIRRQAKTNNWHIGVVTHVKDQFPIHMKEKGYTYYPISTAREVAGGQAWFRKGMMMISLWRPITNYAEGAEIVEEIENRTVKSGQVIVQVQKSKPKGRGKLGEMNLHYRWKEHCFVDDFNLYPKKHEDIAPQIQETLIEEETPF